MSVLGFKTLFSTSTAIITLQMTQNSTQASEFSISAAEAFFLPSAIVTKSALIHFFFAKFWVTFIEAQGLPPDFPS